MAEVAAGAGVALAAEEIVSTGVQAGVAGYMIAKPTLPLKVTYTMIASAQDDSTQRSLARSHHTLTIIDNKAYIFGGETASGELASNDMQAVTVVESGKPEMDYSLIPAIPSQEDKVPKARTKHAACAFHRAVAVFGGCNGKDEVIDDECCIWLFDPKESTWKAVSASNSDSTPGRRYGAKIFAHGDSIVLYGGEDKAGSASDVWSFDTNAEIWTQLPTAPVSTSNAALANGQLYLISASDPMSSQLHHLDLSAAVDEAHWDTFTFPTNPMAPGPRPRHDGGLLPITTGFGRNYLAYLLGAREKSSESHLPEDVSHDVTQWSDMWTLQLLSSDLQPQAKLSISEVIKPAKIKDAIRSAFGADSGQHAWAEVEVQVPTNLEGEGKLHPGPRAYFGCDVLEDGKSAVLWGGENAKGERIGDGWILRLE
ncbi:hypothetical protein K491DRAFT_605797 [Lophiostoma macrostomum CBS 122681]|uniref:Galactose oxidase n=1 Tax=Lophiostoma macrostomum CBS 122681 TaxID=1314788 RepID=A0A6A6T0E9_9PLEO|nr:hypothetical protein K491DRAFT_605797 [Lophiostoma macrostomum CBS 122681]